MESPLPVRADLPVAPRRAWQSGRAAGRLAAGLAAGLALYAVYWALAVVETRTYRTSFLLLALLLVFLTHPTGVRASRLGTWVDGLALAGCLAAFGWPLISAGFADRAASPGIADRVLAVVAVLLVLEAGRRCAGGALTLTAVLFLVYAWAGPWLDRVGLGSLAHRGYGLSRLTGTLYMGLEGLFGVPLDVAATYVALFALYGAALEAGGAVRFFLDWAFAVFGRQAGPSAPARTVAVAGFLLGTVSGSGVATTVALGAPGWPLLRRAGYPAETAGAILAAAGIGALLSPPTLGAAAFLIAEFLELPYLELLAMVTLPTALYYLSVWLLAESEARALGLRPVEPQAGGATPLGAGSLHFVSLAAVPVLMAAGSTPFRAVLWATLLALLTALVPGLARGTRQEAAGLATWGTALVQAGRAVVEIAVVTAVAGIVVGVTGLTGLGLKAAGLIVATGGGALLPTLLYGALAVWVLGLALPVTASYVLAAVTVAPALVQVGVPEVAAHLFIFYYAVLSEVSPPTALAPMAAAALTGGRPLRTMLHTWRYTLPAFLVPLAFTASPDGAALLLRAGPLEVLRVGAGAALGVAALAGGLGGYAWRPLGRIARTVLVAAGLLLLYGHPAAQAGGLGLGLVGLLAGRRR